MRTVNNCARLVRLRSSPPPLGRAPANSPAAPGLSGPLSNIAEYGSCAGASFATASAGAGQHIVRGFTTTSAFTGRSSGRCLNAPSTGSGAQMDIESCNGPGSQYWTFMPNTLLNTRYPAPSSPLSPGGGPIQGFLQLGTADGSGTSMCLDNNSQSAPGSKVIVRPCSGDNPHQQWMLNPNGSIQSVDSGLCVDTANGGTGRRHPARPGHLQRHRRPALAPGRQPVIPAPGNGCRVSRSTYGSGLRSTGLCSAQEPQTGERRPLARERRT
ncbi:RICIN domain-containing protein [Kitasatospora griseola]|uniref:RICIN domain-containing protein n=1 Tax=Kitasatospora griseola TaxID=2064 RepID=UPI00383035B1